MPTEDGWEDVVIYDGRKIIPSLFPGARVTSTSRPEDHPLSKKNPNSRHINNPNAFDVRPIPGVTFEEFIAGLTEAGYKVEQPLDEAKNPSPHATGKHWHGIFTGGPANDGWEDVTPNQAAAPPAPTAKPAPAPNADPLADAARDSTPDLSDPVTRRLMKEQTDPNWDPASNDAVAGSNLGPENVPGGSWAERVATALQTGVLPPEAASLPYIQQVDSLLRLMAAGTEAIRGTPLEGIALASPAGGLEVGGPAALGRIAKRVPLSVDVTDFVNKSIKEGRTLDEINATLRASGETEQVTPDSYAAAQKWFEENPDSAPLEVVQKVDEPVAENTDIPERFQPQTALDKETVGKRTQRENMWNAYLRNSDLPETEKERLSSLYREKYSFKPEPKASEEEIEQLFNQWLQTSDDYSKHTPFPEEGSAPDQEMWFKSENTLWDKRERAQAAYYRALGKEADAVNAETNLHNRNYDEQLRINQFYNKALNDNEFGPKEINFDDPESVAQFEQILGQGPTDPSTVSRLSAVTRNNRTPTAANDTTGGSGPTEPPNIENIVGRLETHVSAAKRNRASNEEARALARKEKAQRLAAAREQASGRESLYVEKASQSGELPGKHFDPIPDDSFTPEEVNTLFDFVKNHKSLSYYDSVAAREGLDKLFRGEVPAPKELGLLEKVLGKDLIKETLKHRTAGRKFYEGLVDVANLPFALMSTYDLSAFRQGAFLVSRPEFWKNAPNMGKYLFSEDGYKAAMKDIESRPTYAAMQEADVAFADLGSDLTLREENFSSKIADKIPGIKQFGRAYTGYLNKLRADVFDSIYRDFEKAGVNITESPTYLKQLGNYINDATGRGNLGSLGRHGPALNATLFSPRLQASRINLLFRPFKYVLDPVASRTGMWEATHPVIKKNYFRDLTGFSGAVLTTLYLAKMNGVDVETDPRSSDFAKIRDGNTRHDILAGFQQYLRLGAQLASNETKTLKGDVKELGKGFGQNTRFDQVITFIRSKGSPIATFLADYLDGKNIVGQPFELQTALVGRLTPFTFQTFYDAYVDGEAKGGPEQGLEQMFKTVDGVFGAGVQTFDPYAPRETVPEAESTTSTPIDVEDITTETPINLDEEGWEDVQ